MPKLTYQKSLYEQRKEELERKTKALKEKQIEETEKQDRLKQIENDLTYLRLHTENKYFYDYIKPYEKQLRRTSKKIERMKKELEDCRKDIIDTLTLLWENVSEDQRRLEENYAVLVEKLVQRLKVIDSRSKAQ